MIAHVVLFTPRAALGPGDREGLLLALENACRNIPSIRRVRVGRRRLLGFAYDSLSPLHFEFAAVLEFDTEADLRAYLSHPAHVELGRRFTSLAEVAVAHDFEMADASGIRAIASPQASS